MRRYTAKELRNMTTVHQGHFDNLKVETENTRVWLSRCSIEDGEPYNNKVTVESLIDGKWEIVDVYKG